MKKDKRSKAPLLTLCLLLVLVALAVYLLPDLGFGLGAGEGSALLPAAQPDGAPAPTPAQPQDRSSGGGAQADAGVVEIRVEEDRITAGGEAMPSVEALEEYIQAVHTDETSYLLIDAHARQQTYAEVRALLDLLRVDYVEGREG